MKVLFVSSGNRKNGLNPIIRLQAESLARQGVEITHFLIFGKGFKGYLQNVFKLKKYLKEHSVDLIHAHFGFSCIVAQLAKGKLPLLVTLMGTDVMGHKGLEGKASLGKKLTNWLNLFFARNIYKEVIVKSKSMKVALNRAKDIHVIPNGVNTNLFSPVDKDIAFDFLNWDRTKHHLVFFANPARPEKNYVLAQNSVELLKAKNLSVELHAVHTEQPENLKYYYAAASALLLPSFHEGSPNVVKEALACNCPIVSTEVGDVLENTHGLEGCFIAPFSVEGFAEQIFNAIKFSQKYGRIKGQEQIAKLGLDEQLVAKQIITIYQKMIQ